MNLLREIPAKWWAVLLGVAFGSLALIAMDGPKKGYGRTIVTACLTAPLLSVLAGAMLPSDTSLEIAALIGGVTTLGGMAVIVAVSRLAPSLVTAGLTGIARTYLEINPTPQGKPDEVTRRREDGTPENPEPTLDELARRFDERKDDET